MKTYRGSPGAARNYVEADRARADDYYLAEGNGAERYTASPTDGVRRLASLTGERYEAWLAGFDPETGEPEGAITQRRQSRPVRRGDCERVEVVGTRGGITPRYFRCV